MSDFSFVLAALVVLGLVAEHYFPYWMHITGRRLPDPVRLIVNYIAGTLVWFGAFSLWLVINGYWEIAVVGWGFASLAGITVIFLYAIDSRIALINNLRDEKKINDLLERRKDVPEKRSR